MQIAAFSRLCRGILRKQLVDETAVARQLARGILVRIQTDAVDAAAELFLLPVCLVERPVEHALVLHPSAKRLPFAAGAAVRQRGFRGQIHGLCAGLIPAELRQVDIPEQVRDSDGEQDAQNDQRNSQLYQGKAAFPRRFPSFFIVFAGFAVFCTAARKKPPEQPDSLSAI